ncbi:SDR family NAD(P)-dependent oxidoreductase [Nocardia sp. AG03]|uniref:SDR family NAD(P)-dependent oxidoreductase n=1 Tax=Nocardia sp. AG03 TaxID=3025312 RepID=UPI002418A84B|nr:SDR family NAD(P)-dependent oxidoreductase [Nocardia sp. AG03]
MSWFSGPSVAGRKVLITGAARGIGAALAVRLAARGAQVALLGLEPELLAEVAAECGGAPWRYCDVADRAQVERVVEALVAELGGLDVLVANAGIAKQMAMVGGDPGVLEETLAVNVLGAAYAVQAAGAHIARPGGYVLMMSSISTAVQLPLAGAYSASAAAIEALAITLRCELRATGARVGISYFAEIDTDMTRRGFGTAAAHTVLAEISLTGISPIGPAVDALERAIARRSKTVVSPWWVALVLPVRPLAQLVVQRLLGNKVARAVEIARTEDVPFTTTQPARPRRMERR